MNKQHLSSLAAVLAAGCLCLPAQAAGPYAGASLGVPHFGDGGVNGITDNGSGVSGKLFGGYQFTPNFALEAGLADLGRIESGSARSHGEYLDAVGILPLGDAWSLLGRLGVAHAALKTSAGDDSGNGLKLGLGAQYALSGNLALRAEWERYRPKVFGTRTNVDQYLVGVRFGF